MRLSKDIPFKILFLLLACIVCCYALGYDWIYADATEGIAHKFKQLNPLLVYSHLIGGATAIAVGAMQLFTRRASNLHRWLGRTYCAAVLIGGIGGGYLAFFADYGPWTGLGFFTLDILWLYCTFTALQEARAHRIQSHSRWMIRSLALTAAAISLRIELPLYSLLWDFETSYNLVAWSCWCGNLIIAELYIYLTSRPKPMLTGNVPS